MAWTVEAQTAPGTASTPAALRRIVLLQQLALEAGLSATRNELVFRILNRTNRLLPYDRATLWLQPEGRLRIGGVSGEVGTRTDAVLIETWTRCLRDLEQPNQTQALLPASFRTEAIRREWSQSRERLPEPHDLWVPVMCQGRAVAGLLLERHAGPAWSEEEKRAAASLAVSYGIAWRPFRRRAPAGGQYRRALLGGGVALLAALLALLPVPLRVVAPCEVIPEDPVAVAAPLDGVVAEVCVQPGSVVAEGDLLARYDGREVREARAVAREQVEIIRADLRRARVKAFDSPEERAALKLLENRLAREEEVLARAERRMRDLEVRAPAAGVVVLDDPDAWRGRPAVTGERICTLVDPERTRAVLWLSVDDQVDFPAGAEVSVLLRADPRARRSARLSYVASESAPRSDGAPAFRAEAVWSAPDRPLSPGLQGTAVLKGERVPLGYWLVRRPLAWLRATAGI